MVVVPSKMGRLNKRALVSRLQLMGSASRAGLAKSLGLSQPTAGKIVEQLLHYGVVEEFDASSWEADASAGKVGRPPRLLRLDRRHKRFLAIQLGVGETSFAALPAGVGAEDRWELRLPTPNSAKQWQAQLREAARRVQPRKFWGVLVSIPGVVDERQGRVLFSPNLHWTEGAKLGALIRQVWKAPVTLIQEERALALGQQMIEPSEEGFLMVDFGEGVGGAVIVQGRLQVNPLPVCGEFGHTPVWLNQRLCGCGARGCLETLVSTRGLLQSFSENTRRKNPSWRDLVEFVHENGVPRWMAQTLDQTAHVIAGALNILGLKQVVVSGSLLEFDQCVFRYLAKAIAGGAMWGRFGKIDVKPAPRRRTAGLIAVGLSRLIWPDQGKGAPGQIADFAREED